MALLIKIQKRIINLEKVIQIKREHNDCEHELRYGDGFLPSGESGTLVFVDGGDVYRIMVSDKNGGYELWDYIQSGGIGCKHVPDAHQMEKHKNYFEVEEQS